MERDPKAAMITQYEALTEIESLMREYNRADSRASGPHTLYRLNRCLHAAGYEPFTR